MFNHKTGRKILKRNYQNWGLTIKRCFFFADTTLTLFRPSRPADPSDGYAESSTLPLSQNDTKWGSTWKNGHFWIEDCKIFTIFNISKIAVKHLIFFQPQPSQPHPPKRSFSALRSSPTVVVGSAVESEKASNSPTLTDVSWSKKGEISKTPRVQGPVW